MKREEQVEQKYDLTITVEQARVIKDALDFHSRLQCGQIVEIRHLFFWKLMDMEKVTEQDQALIEHAINTLREVIFPELQQNESYGIYDDCPETAKIAYDLIQVIRYRLAHDNPNTMKHSVELRKPMKCANSDLPSIKETEDNSAKAADPNKKWESHRPKFNQEIKENVSETEEELT